MNKPDQFHVPVRLDVGFWIFFGTVHYPALPSRNLAEKARPSNIWLCNLSLSLLSTETFYASASQSTCTVQYSTVQFSTHKCLNPENENSRSKFYGYCQALLRSKTFSILAFTSSMGWGRPVCSCNKILAQCCPGTGS